MAAEEKKHYVCGPIGSCESSEPPYVHVSEDPTYAEMGPMTFEEAELRVANINRQLLCQSLGVADPDWRDGCEICAAVGGYCGH